MIKKIIIIGGNVFNQDGPLLDFVKLCKKNNIEIFLITDNIHLEYPTKSYGKFKRALKKLKINYRSFKKFNNNAIKFIKNITKNQNTIIFSINSIWIFNQKTISYFKNIYNYHGADLPTQRGAACHSWRIMMNNYQSSLNIHIIKKEIDQGEIVVQKKINIPKYCVNLSDCYEYLRPIEVKFFNSFIKKLKKGNIKKIKQNNQFSFYWPRLVTAKNGYIDWSWKAKDIVSFSNAFDSPFQGVSTFLKKNKVFLTKAKLVDKNKKFHPFQSGLIYRKNKNKICVATYSGGVSFNYLTRSKINIRTGDRLHTDIKSLFLSRGLE